MDSASLLFLKENENQKSSSAKVKVLISKIKESENYTYNTTSIEFLRLLKIYNETCAENPETQSNDIEVLVLLKELRRLRFTIKAKDLTYLISEGDILEIYDLNGIQRFRNFEYFLHSSYSLYELITTPWEKLFSREDCYLQIVHSEIANIMASDGETAYAPKVPIHRLREINGRRFEFKIFYKYGWPLFDEKGDKCGFLVSQKAERIISPNLSNLF